MAGFFLPGALYMRGHREVTKNPPLAAHPSRLLPYKQPVPASRLECAVTESCATVHSKGLTQLANSFRMRSYTKTRGEGPLPRSPLPPPLTRKETFRRSGPSGREASFSIWHASSLRRMLLLVDYECCGSLPSALFPFSIFTFPFSRGGCVGILPFSIF